MQILPRGLLVSGPQVIQFLKRAPDDPLKRVGGDFSGSDLRIGHPLIGGKSMRTGKIRVPRESVPEKIRKMFGFVKSVYLQTPVGLISR